MTDTPPKLDKSGGLDPASLDVTKRRRRRRARNRPEPSPELRAWEVDAEKRAFARPVPPGVMLEPAGFDEEHWTSPHNDLGLWSLQLADAFGTRSTAVFVTFMHQLERLTGKDYWDEDAKQWRLDENEFSASLAIINSTKPRNEIEACQAAQMVAVHLLTMKVAAYAIRHEYDHRSAITVAKLANAFSGQIAASQSLKGKSRSTRQTIKVTKESHYHDHRHVHTGGGHEIGGRPHERERGRTEKTPDQCAALPSSDPGGNVVPLPSDPGSRSMRAARGKVAGRAEG